MTSARHDRFDHPPVLTPITPRQFDLGINDDIEEWMRQAYAFLSVRRDQASTAREIAQNLEAGTTPAAARDLRHVVQALERALAIQKRIVRNSNYYAFWHEMNTQSWEVKAAGLTRETLGRPPDL